MRPAAQYAITYTDGTEAVAEVRPTHWLRLERSGHAGLGTYEQVLRVIHDATGTDADFDTWVDHLAEWHRVDPTVGADDDDPPSDRQPGTSPD